LQQLFKNKKYRMEQQKKSTAVWWLVFFLSTALLSYMIYSHNEWLTLVIPFVTTGFVKAMDIM
jgi:hypothetical protein